MKARLLPSGKYSVPINYYDEFGKRRQTSRTAATEAKAFKMAQDFLDGKIELSCEAITGPNLMIDRVVLMEDK